jgi:hypothetical protein
VRTLPPIRCRDCGYDLSGIDPQLPCPECASTGRIDETIPPLASCDECAFSLDALGPIHACPRCGRPIQHMVCWAPYRDAPRLSIVAAAVTMILTVGCVPVGFLLACAGLVLGLTLCFNRYAPRRVRRVAFIGIAMNLATIATLVIAYIMLSAR